jgi:DNA end-binding protein Ku
MVDLAEHLLDTKASKFNPDKFKDKYESALKALVKRKAAGKTIEVTKAEKEESNVIDLMDALKQSLGRKKPSKVARKEKRSKTRSKRRKAA